MASKPGSNRKLTNLALQGGGAHGAFTWGVLDRLFEDGRIDVPAISGTSAGAMNAVVAVDGWMTDGFDGARAALHRFWRAISATAVWSPVRRAPWDVAMGSWRLDHSPGYRWFEALTRMFSPYDLNPLDINPLRRVLEDHVDFDRVRACETMKLYVSATNVETGRVRVFNRRSLTADMVMASACLPQLYQAVEIDGIPYWDGGYMGNPSLFPLYNGSPCNDVVVVQINPVERKGTPKSAQEIMNRVNEIAFNSSLLKDLRAIDFVHRLVEEGRLEGTRYQNIRVHIIENGAVLKPLGASSKLNAEWAFLVHLRDLGRMTAECWLRTHLQDVGVRSTADIRSLFQGTVPD